MKLTNAEAIAIAGTISPIFTLHLAKYSFTKYPSADYARYKSVYASKSASNAEVHASLVWKWGHVGKDNFPEAQLKLIRTVENLWPEYVQAKECIGAKETFAWWRSHLPKTAYITAAYITHLVHHADPLPIIDQHNFRAMNSLIRAVRPTHVATSIPRTWQDIEDMQSFISEILVHLPGKSAEELDRFLMMYGRSIKLKKPKKPRKRP